jgi:hypothetical protein
LKDQTVWRLKHSDPASNRGLIGNIKVSKVFFDPGPGFGQGFPAMPQRSTLARRLLCD